MTKLNPCPLCGATSDKFTLSQEMTAQFEIGHALSDIGYHGWEGEAAKNEIAIYNKIELSYLYLLKSLAEAIGYEFPEDQDVWKYHLSKIDTNDVLTLKHK